MKCTDQAWLSATTEMHANLGIVQLLLPSITQDNGEGRGPQISGSIAHV